MGAKPALLGPSFGSANFNVACALPENKVWPARTTPNPAAPTKIIIASASAIAFGLPQNLHGFMFSPLLNMLFQPSIGLALPCQVLVSTLLDAPEKFGELRTYFRGQAGMRLPS